MRRALTGALLLAVLALPSVRLVLERVMITHMLFQIPLLAVAGALLSSAIPSRWREALAVWNRRGISGILLALIASSWWMVPRALDLVLANPGIEIMKFVTLPLFVGAPVALSWNRLGGIGQGFVIANVLPMWAVAGWIYLAAPVRICNYYLVEQQVVTGESLLWVSAGLAGLTAGLAFRTHRVVAIG